MTFIPWWARWLALFFLLVASAAFFYVRGADAAEARWALKDAQRIAQEASAAASLSESRRKREASTASAVAAIDRHYQEEINHATQDNQRMQRALATGAVRVHVAARCDAARGLPAPASAPGVGDDATTAELDPAFASELEGIANEGDSAIRQLTACQQLISVFTSP